MTDDELADILATLRVVATDHADVEAKAARDGFPKRLWETLSAFANTLGGTLILGVDERSGFSVCGVPDAKKFTQDCASVCDQMEPPLRPQIRAHRVEGKHVVVVEVPEIDRAAKPCFYKGAGQVNGSFTRVADGDRKLTQYEVQLMIASRGQPRHDEDVVEEATARDLDQALVEGFFQDLERTNSKLALHTSSDAMLALKAVAMHAGQLKPTIAGLLSMGDRPQRFFPQMAVHFVVYPKSSVGEPGDEQERFLDNRRFEGNIASMVEQSLGAIRQHMARRTTIQGAHRKDVWEYPEVALREAIVNALVHRDLSYGSRGSAVQIQMFSDRLVVMNPGGLFGPVTIESLGSVGVSAARNATLIRLLEQVPGVRGEPPVCENRGSGIGAMVHSLRKSGLEPPRFDDEIASFRVSFPNASLLDDETVRWIQRFAGSKINETQRMALALLRRGHLLDNTVYRQATGLDSRIATKELGDLVERGLIVQIGAKRWTTYRLSSGDSQRRDRRPEIMSLLRRGVALSRAEVASSLAISDGAARLWLSTLRREGQVVLTGPARSPMVKYRVAARKRS